MGGVGDLECLPSPFGPGDKYRFRVDASRELGFLGLGRLIHPRRALRAQGLISEA